MSGATAQSRPRPELVLIAALDRNHAIGRGGALPWHLPDDLRRFKSLTLGKSILMGRKTAQAIGRALPGRDNLVLTRSAWRPPAGMHRVDSLEAALEIAQCDSVRAAENPDTDSVPPGPEPGSTAMLCVIGGGEVYALAMPIATRLHLTHVGTQVVDGDTFFPMLDPAAWRVTWREHHPADPRHAVPFDFVDYTRG